MIISNFVSYLFVGGRACSSRAYAIISNFVLLVAFAQWQALSLRLTIVYTRTSFIIYSYGVNYGVSDIRIRIIFVSSCFTFD